MSRRGVYGSLAESDHPFGAARPPLHSERKDSSFEHGSSDISNPFHDAAGNASSPSSGGGAGRPSWWRAGIVITTAATALAAVIGLAHLASFAGIAQRPTGKNLAKVASADSVVTAPPSGNVDKLDAYGGATPWQQPATTQHNNDYMFKQGVTKEVSEQPEIVVSDASQNAQNRELAFVALNDYTRRGDVVGVGYPWLEGKILVEPYRETSLEVVEPLEGMVYYWSIVETHNSNAGLGEFKGDKVTVTFATAPEYTVALLEIPAESNQVSRMTKVDIFCKYVRREIRSLLDGERDELFDAMKVLWDVKLEEGQKLYGKNYLDVWTIDEFHQIGASDLVCDHLHDGIGFGISHTMVTLMFEMSLQLVNPKLSLPYWDFTIDAYLVDTIYGGDYSHLRDVSDLWTPEWFGSVDPEDFQVKDGRWGNLTVPIVPQEMRDIIGADVYGRMRSPWNVNDRKYLSRGLGEMCGLYSTDFYDWPTCKTHYELQAMYTSYYGWTWHSQYGPHGPTHIWIGGNFDCKKNLQVYADILGDTSANMLQITAFAFIERKGLFRDGLFKCRGIAEETMPAKAVMEEGMCGCLDLDLDKEEDYQAVYEIFASGYDLGDMSEADKKVLATQYCSGVVGIGESSQSSSPLDPTFWSLHPTMERLLMFKRLTGTMTDLSWPDEVGTWVGQDGTEYDVVISTESDTCMGHRGSDVFPYGILSDVMNPQFSFWGKTGTNTINNRDLVHLFDPRVNALSYIYDSFAWSHCADVGYDMNDIFGMNMNGAGVNGFSAAENEAKSPRVDGYGVFRKGAPLKPLYETTAVPGSVN